MPNVSLSDLPPREVQRSRVMRIKGRKQGKQALRMPIHTSEVLHIAPSARLPEAMAISHECDILDG